MFNPGTLVLQDIQIRIEKESTNIGKRPIAKVSFDNKSMSSINWTMFVMIWKPISPIIFPIVSPIIGPNNTSKFQKLPTRFEKILLTKFSSIKKTTSPMMLMMLRFFPAPMRKKSH